VNLASLHAVAHSNTQLLEVEEERRNHQLRNCRASWVQEEGDGIGLEMEVEHSVHEAAEDEDALVADQVVGVDESYSVLYTDRTLAGEAHEDESSKVAVEVHIGEQGTVKVQGVVDAEEHERTDEVQLQDLEDSDE